MLHMLNNNMLARSSACSYNLQQGPHVMAPYLPPGYRFHPTDEELVVHYLVNKVVDCRFTVAAISEADLNKCEPWDLPEKAKMGEKEWYFFSLKDRKYPTGLRTNRATMAGYWKATGKDREVMSTRPSCPGYLVGMKKTLVFYKGRAPKGEKTNWIMHEYRLEGDPSLLQLSKLPCKDEWVVCRIFKKSVGGKKTGSEEGTDVDEPALPALLESPHTHTGGNGAEDTSGITDNEQRVADSLSRAYYNSQGTYPVASCSLNSRATCGAMINLWGSRAMSEVNSKLAGLRHPQLPFNPIYDDSAATSLFQNGQASPILSHKQGMQCGVSNMELYMGGAATDEMRAASSSAYTLRALLGQVPNSGTPCKEELGNGEESRVAKLASYMYRDASNWPESMILKAHIDEMEAVSGALLNTSHQLTNCHNLPTDSSNQAIKHGPIYTSTAMSTAMEVINEGNLINPSLINRSLTHTIASTHHDLGAVWTSHY